MKAARVLGTARNGLVTMLLVLVANNIALAATPDNLADGWNTWRVAAVDNAPNWCCAVWNSGRGQKSNCDLDKRNSTYNSFDSDTTDVEQMQIYVLMNKGEPTKIRTTSAQCTVAARGEIHDAGVLRSEDSIEWLTQHIQPQNDLGEDALAAISVHQGDAARKALLDVARTDSNLENRKNAVFWMGQVRSKDSGEHIKDLMFNDNSAELREHAAFSLSQSAVNGREDALVRLGKNDASPDVRGQAWFWLTQTEAAESEATIEVALREEHDEDVRENAIFALSQLPPDRATSALIAVIKNQKLSRNDREQAIFWLAQSESDAAFDYLGQLISDR